MVRNHEKKTRKIRKNRRTRKRNVGRIRTKKWKTRMSYKTMKRGGGIRETLKSFSTIQKVRRDLMATGTIGSNIDYRLNRIATKMNEFAVLVANERCYIDLWKELFKKKESRMSFTEAYEHEHKNKKKIPFIPNEFLENIPPTIQTLIDSIKKAYEMYQPMHSFKLTSEEFNQALDNVCKGEIHRISGCFVPFKFKSNLPYVNLNESLLQLRQVIDPSDLGWDTASFQLPQTPKKTPIFSIGVDQAVLWKWESDDGTKFNDFSGDYCRMLEQAYKSGLPELQVPEKQWVFDFKQMLQSKIGGTSRKIIRIAPPLKDAYETLHLFFGNEQLLDPNKIKCMACMIVMPNGERKQEDLATEEYGRDYGYKYFDFSKSKRIWSWEVIQEQDPPLEPNMYCSKRVLRRTIEGQPINKTNITKLRYTMSPIIIPEELSNPEDLKLCQNIHDEVLSALLMVAQTIAKTNVSERDSMNQKFQNYEEITFTQILTSSPDNPPEQWKYFFYEIKIYKKKLTYETSKEFDAVIVDFKAFSEDGICGKELIFVSYLHVPNADSLPEPPHLPGTPDFPGAGVRGRGNQVSVSLSGVGSVKEPPSPVIGDEASAKNEIISMFGKKFNELRIKLSFENDSLINRVILSLKTQSGSNQQRTNLGYTSAPATAAAGSFENPNPNDVHHIVLTQDGWGYKWDIQTATTTQINAFNTVQDYIKKTNTWKFENSQNTFVVTNDMEGPDEIKVIVTVKELEEGTNYTLKIVEYQAESAPTYLLFAGRGAAQKYIEAKMGVIATNILPQGGSSALPQAMLPPPLPAGWIQQNDLNGTPFYVHTPTAYVQWDRPLHPLPPPPQQPGPPLRP